jgi:hypothetical protein
MEPKLVVMRFRDGPDKVEHGVYGGEMKQDGIISWLTGVFAERQDSAKSSLTAVARGDAHFPELKVEVRGLMEKFQQFKVEVSSTAYEWGEALVYMSIESGPLVPAFVLLLILFIPTFFQGSSKPKKSKKTQTRDGKPVDDDGVIDFDEDALKSLKESQSGMVVMMFVSESSTDQEMFKRLRGSFWREPVLSFGVVNVKKLSASSSSSSTSSSWREFVGKLEGGGRDVYSRTF